MNNAFFSEEFVYNDKLTFYPITMKDYENFSLYAKAITVNKNSRFPIKAIIKMSYWEFLVALCKDRELGVKYDEPLAPAYLYYTLELLKLACKTTDIVVKSDDKLYVNGLKIDDEIFDDIRRIIIIQNDIDYDIDKFINSNVEDSLRRAREKLNRGRNDSTLEDYIDSLAIITHWNEHYIGNLTIRKFWRYITRTNLRDQYVILKTGESSGFVKFKEPIKHWMLSPDSDKNDNIKTSSETVNKMVG